LLSISAGAVRGTGEESPEAVTPDGRSGIPKEMTEMFTIEEDNGTYTGSLRRHNGYYAGDLTRTPMRTARELSALARLRPPTVPIASGSAD
jgi:hypothetical protein